MLPGWYAVLRLRRTELSWKLQFPGLFLECYGALQYLLQNVLVSLNYLTVYIFYMYCFLYPKVKRDMVHVSTEVPSNFKL